MYRTSVACRAPGPDGGAALPQFRDFLDRFRPAPAPGAASRVAVAADRARQLSDELQPVLALLAATHAECERVVAAAHREARQLEDQAHQQVAATRAEAQRRAEAARATAAEEVIAAARERAGKAVDDALRRARSWRRANDQQVSELVGAAVELIMTLPDGSLAG
jgi:hypothetical protein